MTSFGDSRAFRRDDMPLALQAFRHSAMTRQSCNSFAYDPYIIKDSSYPEGFSIFPKVFSFPLEVYLPALSDCFFGTSSNSRNAVS